MVKRQKLDYDMAELTQNLKQSTGKGVDAFFPSSSPAPAPNMPKEQAPQLRKVLKTQVTDIGAQSTPTSSTQAGKSLSIDTPSTKMVQKKRESKTSRKLDVTNDVKTSLLRDIDKRAWRDIIEETETHNSSLRMSVKEREQMEDTIRTLRRKYKIKTSMNEVARLGLLFLICDFTKNGEQSVIVEVKKS